MKSTILALTLATLITFAAAADQKSNKKPAPKPVTNKTTVITIPAGAVEIAPYTYRATDEKGKTWIYRQTPFGVSRAEDKPLSEEEARKAQESRQQVIDSTTATEQGDSIHFVRNSPFGRTDWQKKKTDLNDLEQAVWNREQAKAGAGQAAAKD